MKNGKALLFSIIELLFTALIVSTLFNYVQTHIGDDDYWFKYYSKDLALSNNLLLAVPNFVLYYEFREDHNYSVILDPDRVILLKRYHTKVLPANSYFSVFGNNNVNIITSRTDSNNFTIIKKPNELGYESEYTQVLYYKTIGLKADANHYFLFNSQVLVGEACQVSHIGSSLEVYDYIIHFERIEGDKIEYSDPYDIIFPGEDPLFKEISQPFLSTEITEYLYIGMGNNLGQGISETLNKLKEVIAIC